MKVTYFGGSMDGRVEDMPMIGSCVVHAFKLKDGTVVEEKYRWASMPGQAFWCDPKVGVALRFWTRSEA